MHSMPGKSRRNSASTVSSASSSTSTSTTRRAPWRAHWRQSSDPIEPPAPVTSTVRAPSQPRIAFQSGVCGSRPSRSSIATSLSWPGRERPSSTSASLGTVRKGTPLSSQCPITRRIDPASEDGMAMTSSWAAVSRAMRATSDVRPSTGSPCRREPRKATASSRNPIGSYWPRRRRSRTSASPAWPAPSTSTRSAPSLACSRR